MSCTLASRFGPIAEAECLVTFLEREIDRHTREVTTENAFPWNLR
jgi:hypothetical protein